MDYLTLDVNGVILAFIMAFVMLFVATFTEPNIVQGWALGLYYVLVMLFFLAISAVVTKVGATYKMSIRQYQKPRGVRNVLANGMGPLIFTMLVYLTLGNIAFVAGFIGSVAAVMADKFSSELGILDGRPMSIITFKKVKKGESGGITGVGLAAGALGAGVVAIVASIVYLFIFPQIYNCPAMIVGAPTQPQCGGYALLLLICATLIGGFVGTLVDSVLGHFEERGIGNKYTSNFVCSIFGGLIGILVYFILL
jgi:uncharacterized protein (TIGR00297 family)